MSTNGLTHIYRFSADDLARHLEQHANLLRTEANSTIVRTAAHNMGQDFEDALVIAASKLPTIRLARTGIAAYMASQQTERDPAFDAAVESFIEECFAAVQRRRAIEERVAANRSLSIDACKIRILEELRPLNTDRWASDLVKDLGIGDTQVLEALLELEEEGAISGQHGGVSDTDLVWRVHLTPRGRRIVDGRHAASAPAPPGPVFHQTFNGPVSNAGVAETVHQTNISLPIIPSDVRAFLESTPLGASQVEVYERQRATPAPNGDLVRNVFGVLKTLIESANLSAEVGAHGHEWLDAVSHALSTWIH